MILIDDKHTKWGCIKEESLTLHYKNNKFFNKSLLEIIKQSLDHEGMTDTLSRELSQKIDFTSGICENDTYIISWVDHVRSIPIFYSQIGQSFFVSNNPRTIQKKAGLDKFNKEAELEFSMAGYVTGRETILEDLNSLQPGEFLVWNKVLRSLSIVRYFQYTPEFPDNDNLETNKKQLSNIIDKIMHKIIKRAKGKTIWVPLSAGLDSRIVLCKLREHGYENIKTFTYGPKYNFEAKYAKRIAKTLDVPWQEIILPDNILKTYFDDEIRKEFWRYADGLKAIPCMREYSAIRYLHDNGLAKSGDIFINGQSGDYITGGHIPTDWCDHTPKSSKEFFKQLINKHYDLWFDLKGEDNLRSIENPIERLLPYDWKSNLTGLDLAKYNEMWEYDGRQVCYVINGQRVYEFFGYDWELPLWDKELVDFYQTIPINQKIGQALYKDYLKEYNYKGLFPSKYPYIWRWPVNMLWVVVFARIIGVIKGRGAKKNFYALMRNKGHYANQYKFFSQNFHRKTYNKCRSIISLYVPVWQSENNEDSSYAPVDLTKISS